MNVLLHLGTNKGDRKANLDTAKQLIAQKIGTITAESKYYETAAWGVTDQADFINQSIAIDTTLTPMETLEACLAIEDEMGRTTQHSNYAQNDI